MSPSPSDIPAGPSTMTVGLLFVVDLDRTEHLMCDLAHTGAAKFVAGCPDLRFPRAGRLIGWYDADQGSACGGTSLNPTASRLCDGAPARQPHPDTPKVTFHRGHAVLSGARKSPTLVQQHRKTWPLLDLILGDRLLHPWAALHKRPSIRACVAPRSPPGWARRTSL